MLQAFQLNTDLMSVMYSTELQNSIHTNHVHIVSIHATCTRTTYLHIVFTKCVNGAISRTICIAYTHKYIASSRLITLINSLTCKFENCTMLHFSTLFLYQERRRRGLITLQLEITRNLF